MKHTMKRILLALAFLALAIAPARPAFATQAQDDNTSMQVQSGSVSSIVATNGPDQVNYSYSGVVLVVDVTTLTGTAPTLTVKVQVKDAGYTGATNKYVDLPGCATAAVSSVSTVQLTCYPGVAVAANATVSVALPKYWRVVGTTAGTAVTAAAWTVGAALVK